MSIIDSNTENGTIDPYPIISISFNGKDYEYVRRYGSIIPPQSVNNLVTENLYITSGISIASTAVFSGTLSGTTGSFVGIVTANTFSGNGTIPVGGIIMWSGSVVSIPSGWALCDGSNGTPDLRNRFVVGAGDVYSVAGIGGTTDSVVVSHTHEYLYRGTETVVSGAFSSNTVGSDSTVTGITSSTGESGVNKNLPPYYALAFIMRTL